MAGQSRSRAKEASSADVDDLMLPEGHVGPLRADGKVVIASQRMHAEVVFGQQRAQGLPFLRPVRRVIEQRKMGALGDEHHRFEPKRRRARDEFLQCQPFLPRPHSRVTYRM